MIKTLLLLFCVVIMLSCDKEQGIDKQYYMDFNPDLTLNVNDSILIDIDNNRINDIVFKVDQFGRRMDRINDSVMVSMGVFSGSGSSSLDTIAYNELINENSQEWYAGFNLFTQEIHYVAVCKNDNINLSYGWIKLELLLNSIIIDEFYFRRMPGREIRAGIKDYD